MLPKYNRVTSCCVCRLWCGRSCPTVTCSSYNQIDCSKHRSCWSSVLLSGAFLFLRLISGCWYSLPAWSSVLYKVTRPRQFPIHLHSKEAYREAFKDTCISQLFSWINNIIKICTSNTAALLPLLFPPPCPPPFFSFYLHKSLNVSLLVSFGAVRILQIMLIAASSQWQYLYYESTLSSV